MVNVIVRQVAYEQRAFWRNLGASFFAVGFPVVMLLIFGQAVDEATTSDGQVIRTAAYLVPGMAAFAVMSITLMHVASIVIVHRDSGYLQQLSLTERGRTVYPLGLLLATCIAAIVGAGVLMLAGTLFFDVGAAFGFGRALAAVAIGAPAFVMMAGAITIVMPNTVVAQPILTGLFYSVAFASGVFVPLTGVRWFGAVVAWLPTTRFVMAMQSAYDTSAAFPFADLGIVVVFGVVCLGLAHRWFRWDPRRGHS